MKQQRALRLIANHRERSVVHCKVEAQLRRRGNWNTWIVTCSLIVLSAALLFLEHHIRGLHSILSNDQRGSNKTAALNSRHSYQGRPVTNEIGDTQAIVHYRSNLER